MEFSIFTMVLKVHRKYDGRAPALLLFRWEERLTTEVIPTPHVIVTDDGTNYKFHIYIGMAVHYSSPDTYTTYSEANTKGQRWMKNAYENGFLPYYGDD